MLIKLFIIYKSDFGIKNSIWSYHWLQSLFLFCSSSNRSLLAAMASIRFSRLFGRYLQVCRIPSLLVLEISIEPLHEKPDQPRCWCPCYEIDSFLDESSLCLAPYLHLYVAVRQFTQRLREFCMINKFVRVASLLVHWASRHIWWASYPLLPLSQTCLKASWSVFRDTIRKVRIFPRSDNRMSVGRFRQHLLFRVCGSFQDIFLKQRAERICRWHLRVIRH